MADVEPNLDGLLALALDRSAESRQRLAEEVGDICDDSSRVLTEQERDLVFEILKKLLYDFEVPVRARLSEKLATTSNIPRELILTLANDEIAVAQPVLLHSRVLRDPDLIEIIRHRGRQHQLSVARRSQLSEVVSEVLVETDDEDVIRTLLQNENASISETTMAYLVEESRRVDSFQEPLVNRKDLPEALARKLYWWVAAALRQSILEKFDLSPSQLDPAIEGAVHDLQVEELAHAGGNSAVDLARRLGEQNAITPLMLIKVLRRGEIALFEALFAELTLVDLTILRRFIHDENGDRMAIVCRALAIPKDQFATIFMLTRSKGRVMKPSELSRATRVFDKVSPENAKEILASWQVDPAFQEAVEDLAKERLKGRA